MDVFEQSDLIVLAITESDPKAGVLSLPAPYSDAVQNLQYNAATGQLSMRVFADLVIT